jgi:hypothetical protein
LKVSLNATVRYLMTKEINVITEQGSLFDRAQEFGLAEHI